MKKNILKLTFITAVAVAAGYTAYSQSQKTEALSDLAMENVEALARGEASVTCEEDPGDTCLVGSTPVSGWDEDDGWF